MEIKVSVVSQEETRGFVERGGDWIGIARDLMKIRQQIKELEAQEKAHCASTKISLRRTLFLRVVDLYGQLHIVKAVLIMPQFHNSEALI